MATLASNRGKLLIPLIAGILVVGIACGVFVFGKVASAKKHSNNKAEPEVKSMVSMAEIVVNLSGSAEQHYLKTTMVLEVLGKNGKSETDESMPKIRDAVIAALSACYFDDLLTAQGKNALKEAVKKRINGCLHESKVSNIYFSDFAMQ